MIWSLIGPSFLAGVLTFLAPCTLPLVPGYLGFISGVSLKDLEDPTQARKARWKIFWNGLWYVIGFSVVFIILGSLVGLGGVAISKYRVLLGQIGGLFVIGFGLYMMQIFRIPALAFLDRERRLPALKFVKPGTPVSSFLFGATFAFGWTPCVGPILGSILLLAATTATVAQGAFLLAVFSLGLGLPFLLVALGIGSIAPRLQKLGKAMEVMSMVGGVFLVFIGVLLLTNKLGFWIGWFFKTFSWLRFEERLLDYL